jgi:hypothetical protein
MNPPTPKMITATPSIPTLNPTSWAPLAGTKVVVEEEEAAPPEFVELVLLDVPVLLVVIPTKTLLVLFRLAGADVVVNTATTEVDGFVLVADALMEVVTATGREVVPCGGVVEVVV